MKELQEPLYQFISEQREVIKKEFILFAKDSVLNGPYYMLLPKNSDISIRSAHIGELTVVSYHFTIYEKNKKEVQNAAFHITIELIDTAKQKYVARIYYTECGEYLFNKVKKGTDNLSEINFEKKLLDFGKQNIAVLLNIILKLQQNYNEQYLFMVEELKKQSMALENTDNPQLLKDKLFEYKKSLLMTINHIKSGTMFNQDHLAELKIHEGFLWDTQQKLNQQQENVLIKKKVSEHLDHSESISQPVIKANETNTTNNRVKIDELNKKIAIIVNSKKIRTPGIVVQEYELQSKKLSLLNTESSKSNKKTKRLKNNIDETDLMSTMSQMSVLQAEINNILLDFLDNDKRYKSIDKESMNALLQKCSLKTSVLLELAVKNNRLLFLKNLIQLREDIDLDGKGPNENQHLLEIAYEKRYVELFKCLLEVIGNSKGQRIDFVQ